MTATSAALAVASFTVGVCAPWLAWRVRRWWYRDYESSMRVIDHFPRCLPDPKRRRVS